MPASVSTPDLIISLAAAMGLLFVRAHIDGRSGDGLAWRFRFALLVSALFYLTRALDWVSAIGLMRSLSLLAAAIVPLSAVLIVEGLLRRHVPLGVKYLVIGGVVLFGMGAFFVPMTRSVLYLLPFLLFQITLFVAAWVLLLRRDRTSLSEAENSRADRFALVVPLILLLLLSDYRVLPMAELPRLSGFAALIVAWIGVTLEAQAARLRNLLQILGLIGVLSGVAALAVVAEIARVDARLAEAGFWNLAFVIATLMLLLVVLVSTIVVRQLRGMRALDDAISALGSRQTYLEALDRLGLKRGFVFLTAADLPDYDPATLTAALGPDGAQSLAGLPDDPANDTLGQSQLRELLHQSGATELYLISERPFMVAVGSPVGIGAVANLQQRTAFRLASLAPMGAQQAENGNER